ncbi:Predicted DNA-binding protein, UPF0251 family [Lachnospiraceae bacterium C7]|nr:Predicted DNA-binding protein, UPF0251 family [Lachnospiraceae bacterium C7]
MPRPTRLRKIDKFPEFWSFQAADYSGEEVINLTLDEYETIRLIDFEKLTQNECAKLMNVSRPTVSSIYESAREKLARHVVLGTRLVISGGQYELCQNYRLCDDEVAKATIKSLQKKGEKTMRLAATYEDGKIFQHFGHTEAFKVYDICDGEVKESQVIATDGFGHGALAGFLKVNKVDTLICGGIGGGAQMALKEAGINLYAGIQGDADEAVKKLLAGELVQNESANCNHHDHGEGHECGGHGHHGEGHECGGHGHHGEGHGCCGNH